MQRLPSTYHACLREIVRRAQVEADHSAAALSAAEKMASDREGEVGMRDEFMREVGCSLPVGLPALSSLLQARPAYFEVSSSSSDPTLSQLAKARPRKPDPLPFHMAGPTEPSSSSSGFTGDAIAAQPAEVGGWGEEVEVGEVSEVSEPAQASEGNEVGERMSEGECTTWQSPAAATFVTDSAVMEGSLSEVSSALEALGTPLDGVSVEVASELQTRLAAQQEAAEGLRRECESHAAALQLSKARLAEEQSRSEELARELEELKLQLVLSGPLIASGSPLIASDFPLINYLPFIASDGPLIESDGPLIGASAGRSDASQASKGEARGDELPPIAEATSSEEQGAIVRLSLTVRHNEAPSCPIPRSVAPP
ncbi:MAG: hypothetical protein SGPRY_004176 [Prymnesium sp.]